MSDNYDYSSSQHLSVYAIFGIVIGSVVLIVIAIGTWACCRSRTRKSVTPENPRSNVQEVQPSQHVDDVEAPKQLQTQKTNQVKPAPTPKPSAPSAPPIQQGPHPSPSPNFPQSPLQPFLPAPIPSPPLNHYTAFANPYSLYVPMQNYQFSAHTAHIHLPPIQYPQIPNGTTGIQVGYPALPNQNQHF